MTLPEAIRKFLRRTLLRLSYRLEGSEQEGFDVGGDGVPDADERAAMSAHKMAQKLSDALRNESKDSVAVILLTYELQFKIAKEQSTATYRAAVIGLLGIGVGALIQTSMQQSNNCPTGKCRCAADRKVADVEKQPPVPASGNIPAQEGKATKPGEYRSVPSAK